MRPLFLSRLSRLVAVSFFLCAAVALGCGGNLSPDAKLDASLPATDGSATLDEAGQPDDAGSSADAPCSVLLASSYDQSCAVDTDCVQVGEVTSCPPPPCAICTTSAVNKSVAVQYDAVFTPISATFGGACGCPCEGPAICREGKCQAGSCTPASADTLPACADAGGRCAYSLDTTCNLGPPDACAFSDEICCL